MVDLCVVQGAVGGCTVALGASDRGFVLFVDDVEEGAAGGVGALAVGLAVVLAADSGDEEVGVGQLTDVVVVG